jgi:DNA-binding NtrC family response regulator
MVADVFARPGLERPSRSKKVLVVDDEAGDLRTLRLTFEGQGFEVFTCASYEAGLQCLNAERFDFVVVSQGTEAFEGRAVLERAMQLDRSRPVLVLTRCISMPCYLEAMQMGALDYLEKPVPPTDLLRFVRAHVAVAEGRFCGVSRESAGGPA